jgi:alginate O-acetyltransferase complex protein AlgJ
MLAAQAIAERVKAKLPPAARRDYTTEWKDTPITGDLVALLGRDAAKPSAESIALRLVSEKGTGAAVKPDPNSPVLVMGDSHTLVFSEFLAQRAGLVDQLAAELGFAPDLIGTRGSGATAVRISLYRKARADAGYLAKKKVVVWCFAAREFTETDQGWVPQPIAK